MNANEEHCGGVGETARANALREAMVGELRRERDICSARVAEALRTVPRHLFSPEHPLETVYDANRSLVTKRDEHGLAISSVSAPWLQAMMLEQAQLGVGMRVLEVGSGGYNAALISELVGSEGSVTTVDIDPDVVDRAQRCLAAAGYDQVNVVLSDATGGVVEHAPYDRVIITAGAWDIPPAWQEQLVQGGRLVVPLRMRGLTRSIVFERQHGNLISRTYELCGFVPMQGAGEHRERLVALDGEAVSLRIDDRRQVDADILREALFQPRVQEWSTVTIGSGERFDGLHLWLAATLPVFGLLAAQQDAVDRGIVAHAWPLGMPTVFDGESFAYLSLRPVTPERRRFEFGVYGHGPRAKELANLMTRHIQSWDGSSLSARIEVYPAGTPDDQLPEGACVIDKKYTRVLISWPGESD